MSRKVKIDCEEWMGDIRIKMLAPMAELLLFKLTMLAEPSEGWLMHNDLPLTLAELSSLTGVPSQDLEGLLVELKSLVEFDNERHAYFLPDRVKAADISRKRSAAAKKGGGNPKLQGENACAEDLFKQNQDNVIRFKKSNGYGKGARGMLKKKKETKKKKYNNNIYTSELDLGDSPVAADNPLWFEHGCVRLTKRDYQRWHAELSCWTEEKLHEELVARANWLETRPADEQQRWFFTSLRALRKRHAAIFSQVNNHGGVNA